MTGISISKLIDEVWKMNDQRPSGREKRTTGHSTGVHKTGSGLGTGPVGSSDGYAGRNGSSGGGRGVRRAAVGGGLSLPVIIILVILMMMKNNGGQGGYDTSYDYDYDQGQSGGYYSQDIVTTAAPVTQQSTGSSADSTVAEGSRAKRTIIKGNGEDTVTLMVYMCGTDLESKYGMATNDLREMASADLSDKVNIIAYTGGCNQWKTSSISSSVNQIYKVEKGGIANLVNDDGAKRMTDPDTLSGFIKYCAKNFPADRYELILWDHGGGSVSGYGYDEKYKSGGSMKLGEISKALKDGGVAFDFIGFDACLMATAETALMLDNYADYMIASEETEPGIGWYYTNWLSRLSADTSMPTVDIGKNIIDDYTNACSQQCRGQKTTLSIVDLAEFANTVPDKLNSFSRSISKLVSENDYKRVTDARYLTREFAPSSKIDQVDLMDFADRVGTREGRELCDAIKGAVKYNRISGGMTNAYGISVYFPYKRTSYVDSACDTYSEIGMDDDYAKCIRQFASLEISGQAATGGTASPVSSLFGDSIGSIGADAVGSLLNSFLGGDFGSIAGLSSSNTGFLSDRALSDEDTVNYITSNYFDSSALFWNEDNGEYTITLSDNQWDLVHDIDMNMFYDDGEGYVDLGLDTLYTVNGNTLKADTDRLWMAVNGQIVAFYHTDTAQTDDGQVLSGYIPAFLNGDRAKLLVVFDKDDPYGRVTGAVYDYRNGETDTVAKSLTEIKDGDELRFVCDYYSYDKNYLDTYYLGQPMTVDGELFLSNEDVGDGNVKITYRFTDIYDQQYWTEAIDK